MAGALTFENRSPGFLREVERARHNSYEWQLFLVYLMDVESQKPAYHRIPKKAMVGVDGVTKEQYGQELEDDLQSPPSLMKI